MKQDLVARSLGSGSIDGAPRRPYCMVNSGVARIPPLVIVILPVVSQIHIERIGTHNL